MTPDNKGLKARLMAEAEEAIDKLLAGVGEKEEVKLSDIEQLVRVAGEQVMERFMAGLVEAEAGGSESCICPACGGKLRDKGKKSHDLITETGEVRLERSCPVLSALVLSDQDRVQDMCYYCPSCRQGIPSSGQPCALPVPVGGHSGRPA